MKKLNLVGILLLFIIGTIGCESAVQEMDYDNEMPEETYYEEVDFSEKVEELCLYLRKNDMDSALSLINEFLVTLPNDEYLTLHLRDWLELVPSVIGVWTEVLLLPTMPSIARVHLFMENEIDRGFLLYFIDPPTAKRWEHVATKGLCLYLNYENIDKAVNIINEFLATLPNDISISQKLDNLESWLKAVPCITEVNMLSYWTNPPIPKGVNFLFTENDVTKRISLDFLTNPLRVYRSDR